MKKLLIVGLLISLLFSFNMTEAKRRLKKPHINGVGAILINAKTKRIFYQKNKHKILAPASTTKIMTAILALERFNLNNNVRVRRPATTREGTSLDLCPNERLTVRELLYGLMLESGNDVAAAIAIYTSGSERKFAKLMTAKARRIGMRRTRFKNASGLPAKGHYTTPYDMALLARYALKNGHFAVIVKTKVKTISGSRPGKRRRLINHNKLLWRYPYTTGIKNGYTRAAGGCLVASARRKGVNLIAVVLKSHTKYTDAKKLFVYGFRHYR